MFGRNKKAKGQITAGAEKVTADLLGLCTEGMDDVGLLSGGAGNLAEFDILTGWSTKFRVYVREVPGNER